MIYNFLNALGLLFCFRWGRRAGRIHSLSHEIVGVKVGGVTCFFWRSSQAASLSARIFFFFCTCLSAVRYRCIDMPNNRRGRLTAELRNGKSGPMPYIPFAPLGLGGSSEGVPHGATSCYVLGKRTWDIQLMILGWHFGADILGANFGIRLGQHLGKPY